MSLHRETRDEARRRLTKVLRRRYLDLVRQKLGELSNVPEPSRRPVWMLGEEHLPLLQRSWSRIDSCGPAARSGNSSPPVKPVDPKREQERENRQVLVRRIRGKEGYEKLDVRLKAVGCLAETGGCEGLLDLAMIATSDRLSELDTSHWGEVRSAILETLVKTANPRVVWTLAAALADVHTEQAAAAGLVGFGEAGLECLARCVAEGQFCRLDPLWVAGLPADSQAEFGYGAKSLYLRTTHLPAIARCLGRFRSARAVAELGRLARSRDPVVLGVVATALGETGLPEAIPYVCQLAAHEKIRVREAAVVALRKFEDSEGFLSALAELGTERPEAVDAVNRWLRTTERSPVPPELLAAMIAPQPAVRRAAVLWLGRFGEPHWSEVVVGDDDDFVRLVAQGDSRLTEMLHEACLNGPPVVGLGLVRGWRSSGNSEALGRAVSGCLAKVRDPVADPWLRTRLAKVLAEAGEEAIVEPLADLARQDLHKQAPSLRLEPRWAHSDAVTREEHELRELRCAIVRSLGRLGGPRALEVIREFLDPANRATTTRLRMAAIDALASAEGPGALGLVEGLLLDPNGDIRAKAAEAAGSLGDSRWKACIRGDFTDFGRLAECGHPGAINHLVGMLSSEPHREGRRRVAHVLVGLASRNPDLLRSRWGEIEVKCGASHMDSSYRYKSPYHTDITDTEGTGTIHNDSSCTKHTDTGIGVSFPGGETPEVPPAPPATASREPARPTLPTPPATPAISPASFPPASSLTNSHSGQPSKPRPFWRRFWGKWLGRS